MTLRRIGTRARWRDPRPARPPHPEYTEESMAREVEENPDIARELFADRFVAGFCVVCADRRADYVIPVWFGPCRRCLAKRMRALLARRDDLPWWVSYLAESCERAVYSKGELDRAGLTVTFEAFYPCARCGKLIIPDDSTYWVVDPSEFRTGSAYCVPCYEQFRGEAEKA